METLKFSVPVSSQYPSAVSFITPKPLFQYASNNSYKFQKTHFKPFSYGTISLLQYCNHLHISAHFSRRSSRHYSLRKKLNNSRQMRPKNPQVPTFENDETNDQSNLAASEKKAGAEAGNVNEIDSGAAQFGRDKGVGESFLWHKLEVWIEQYKKDIEFWGLGSSPIFTVHRDSNGNVKRVLVDDDEILRRSGIPPSEYKEKRELEEIGEVSLKISHARFLAKEMERGNYMLPKSSSVVKFVAYGDNSRQASGIRIGVMRSDFVLNFSKFGIVPLCGLLLVWVIKKIFSRGKGENELTRLENEMLRRKMKSRKKIETFKDGIVEVVPELIVPASEFVERPHLDKDELMNSIRAAMQLNNQMKVLDDPSTRKMDSLDCEDRIQEIKEMAMHAREVEKHEHSPNGPPLIDIKVVDELLDTPDSLRSESSAKSENTDTIVEKESENRGDAVLEDKGDELLPNLSTSVRVSSKAQKSNQIERKDSQGTLKVLGTSDSRNSIGSTISKEACRKKPRVIRSVAEAREYLSDTSKPQFSNDDLLRNHIHESNNAFTEGDDTRITEDHMSETLGEEYTVSDPSDLSSPSNTFPSTKSSSNSCRENSHSPHRINGLNGKAQIISLPSASVHDSAKGEGSYVDTKKKVGTKKKIGGTLVPDSSICASESIVNKEDAQDSILNEENCLRTEINGVNVDVRSSVVQSTSVDNSSSHEEADFNSSQRSDNRKPMSDIVKPTGLGEYYNVPAANAYDENHTFDQVFAAETPKVSEEYDEEFKIEASRDKNNWLEKNFDELLPVLEKMGSGFTDNYVAAREKVKHEQDQGSDLTQLMSALNDNAELEWMNDDKLREIVFKVRDNEIAGRDPFHSMDNEDKITFFKGLEEKVEKESNKLSGFHEWLHSNIENLDYGADGISVYDPPEKIIPRWKGPPFEKIRDFLANTPKAQGVPSDKATNLPIQGNLNMKWGVTSDNMKPLIKVPKKSKTVIESSDGSVKPGKRNGKEHWQHTKKHSRGFLESYNAESDPEIKEVMRDMGKDLDRWITEEEVKKAANHIGKLPRRSKAFVEKKLNKLKSEVEQFGTQAVLSKYCEYAVDEEEDYLWWLDLPYVLCIELYTQEGEEMKVGFYTLEMAADLELDPKPYHVIAFEEPSECKNLCYIIQSHLEMLGNNGKAFVVAQPPKEAFRDAKANGYGVTVIRKGEVLLNVDEPLEEVEEIITEIGSKMYHDKIMKERSVDMRSVMKGVLATSKPARRVILIQMGKTRNPASDPPNTDPSATNNTPPTNLNFDVLANLAVVVEALTVDMTTIKSAQVATADSDSDRGTNRTTRGGVWGHPRWWDEPDDEEDNTRGFPSHRQPRAKINFPKFEGGDPRGWVLKAEKYFRYFQIHDEMKVEARRRCPRSLRVRKQRG
ncbi:hypothetical protein V2J09_004414 [Rumex salicifolius]